MNSDFEMQTESPIPQKISLVNNLTWSFQLWEQGTALTQPACSGAHPVELALLLRFPPSSCMLNYWLNATALLLKEYAVEIIVTTPEIWMVLMYAHPMQYAFCIL